jgi:hypothetical protein
MQIVERRNSSHLLTYIKGAGTKAREGGFEYERAVMLCIPA